MTTRPRWLLSASVIALLFLCASQGHAHGVADENKEFLAQSAGMKLMPYLYLGAKHMVTGYDHLLFLFGVIFFLYRLRDIALYVTLFSIGHSVTLLIGVLGGLHVNPYMVDAITVSSSQQEVGRPLVWTLVPISPQRAGAWDSPVHTACYTKFGSCTDERSPYDGIAERDSAVTMPSGYGEIPP